MTRSRWGLGIEHEFFVQNMDDGSMLSPYDVFTSMNYMGYSSMSVQAPAGQDMDMDTLKTHVRHYANLVARASKKSVSPKKIDNMSFDEQANICKPFVRGLYAGDTLTIKCCSNDVFTVSLNVSATRMVHKPLSHMAALRTFAALRQVVLNNNRKINKSSTSFEDDHDIDYPFIETRSIKYQNATVDSVLKQLHAAEGKVMRKAIDNGFKNSRIYPWSGVVDNPDTTYTGSYHVWVTLPHDIDGAMTTPKRAQILLDHAHLTHMLQWMEPLMMTLYTGDPRALGSTKYSRASMRADHSTYAGYGTTPAKHIAEDTDLGPSVVFEWYETESELVNQVGARRQRDSSWPLFVWIQGHKIPYRKCMGSLRLLYELSSELRNVAGPHISLNDFGNGADVRSRLCETLEVPLLRGYTPRWLRVGDSLELRFLRDKKVLRDAPVNEKKWGKQVAGIEFRAVDNMPSKQIDSLLHLIVLIAAAAVGPRKRAAAINFVKHAATLSDSWQKSLYDVRKYGSHAPANQSYLKELSITLGIDLPTSTTTTMFEALNMVSSQLHAQYSSYDLVSKMHPKCAKNGPPVFDNVGQAAWEEAWHAADKKTRDKAKRNPNNAPYIKELMTSSQDTH